MMNGFGVHGWGMGFFWTIGLIFLVVVIWGIFKTVNQNNKPN
jgi:putative membrane protein